MTRSRDRRRTHPSRTFGLSIPQSHVRVLRFEQMESRRLLSATRLVWNDTSQLTLSFVPDGTDVGGQPSEMFARFNQVARQRDWQEAILRGFQTWLEATPLDVGVVADGGQPLGTPGPRTQDVRFGDIRLAARPMSGEALALAVSHSSIVSGTWAGDIVFNSNADFQSIDEIFQVALHEAGHVFGLEHSDDPASPMFQHGLPHATKPTPSDLANLVRAHGARVPDRHEGATGNDSIATATPLRRSIAGGDSFSAPILAFADLTTPLDIDVFELPRSGRNGSPATIRLQTNEISLMAPTVSVVTADGNEIGQTGTLRPGGATLQFQIDRLDPNERYYLVVQATQPRSFAVGEYSLVVTFDELPLAEVSRVVDVAVGRNRDLTVEQIENLVADATFLLNHDANTDDLQADATPLPPPRGDTSTSRFQSVGSIAGRDDVDYYRFETTGSFADGKTILNLSLHAMEPAGLMPRATVFNRLGMEVPSEVLVNGFGEFVLQAELEGHQRYFIRVDSSAVKSPFDSGNYRLTAALVDEWLEMDTFMDGTVGSEPPLRATSIFVGRSQLFHFLLDVDDVRSLQPHGVVAQINDADGQLVARLSSPTDDVRSLSGVFLEPGAYSMIVFGARLDRGQPTAIPFRLRGVSFSDLFGVDPDDPTEDPIYDCPDEPGMFCYPGGVTSENPYLWLEFLESLPEIPDLGPVELVYALLGEWWSWYWQQNGENGPALALSEQYDVTSVYHSVDAAAGVLANDLDPEGEVLAAVLIEPPEHGTLTLNPDGSFVYLPEAGFEGTDEFRYLAYDFHTESNVATVRLNVSHVQAIEGDFNGDDVADGDDLEMLRQAIQLTDHPIAFDLTSDGLVNLDDLMWMVEGVLGSTIGDANLDGVFTSSDFVVVFLAGQYERGVTGQASWQAGDWNGDGQFSSQDIVFAFAHGQYAQSAEAQTLSPEPSETDRSSARQIEWALAVDWLFERQQKNGRTRSSSPVSLMNRFGLQTD